MKSLLGFACVILAAHSAGAQPGAVPPGSTPPAPAPSPPDQAPTWLPGVTDVTAEETAIPGKLTLSMAQAIELAIKQHPTLELARAAVDLNQGHIDQARVVLHPIVTLGASEIVGSEPVGPCTAIQMNPNAMGTCGGFFSGAATTALSAAASWRITDFGQTTANVHAAELATDAATAGFNSEYARCPPRCRAGVPRGDRGTAIDPGRAVDREE